MSTPRLHLCFKAASRTHPAGQAGGSLPRLRLPSLLLALVLSVLLPSFGVGIWATREAAMQDARQAQDRLLDGARTAALAVSADIAARLQVLQALAASAALDPGATPSLADQALRRTSDVLHLPLALVLPDGTQPIHTALPPGSPVPPTRHLAALRRVFATAQPVVLGLHIGEASNVPTATALVPVLRDGHAVAALAVRLDIDRLRRVLEAQPTGNAGSAFLLDESGAVLTSDDPRGIDLAEGTAKRLADEANGLYRGAAADGEEQVFAFHGLPAAPGWHVLLAQPATELQAAWREPLTEFAIGGTAALLLGLAVAGWVALQVLQPIGRLRRHALAVAADPDAMRAGAAELPSARVAELEALRQGFAAAEDAHQRRARGEQAISSALLSSEARLRELVTTLDLGAFMARHLDGTITYWSGGCAGMYGWTALEAVGEISHRLLGTRHPAPRAEIEATLLREGVWTGELRHRTHDGRELIVHAHQVLERSQDGRHTVLEVLTDLTEQRRAEATLGAVLDALPVGVIIADAHGRIVRDNAANRALWGVPPETANWQAYGEWIGYRPGTGERIKAHEWAMARALLEGETTYGELVENQRFDTGERRMFINNAAPIRDPNGIIIGGVVAELDVTDARRAEAKLAASEARLNTLIETVPVGLVLAEFPSGRIVTGNHYLATLLRHPVIHSAGLDSYDQWVAYHADGTRVRSHEYPLARMALHGDENPSLEVLYLRGDGTRSWMRFIGRPVRDPAGRLTGGVMAILDIDAETRSREAMERSAEQLEQVVEERTRALRASEARLEHAAKMEALGRLAAGVAHDFNNILQVVEGSAGLAATQLHTDPHRAETLLAMVTDAASRGMAVTGRLLTFARRGELVAESIAPGPLLENLAQMLRHTMPPNAELRVVAAPDVPPLLADRGQLETVLVNLANNARDALPRGTGVITLLAACADQVPADLPDGPYVRLAVIDTGSGMPSEVQARVSEPFFTTKPHGRGTGLGLAMARGFAEQSGGALAIESAVGRGTTVSVLLPAAAPADRSRQAPAPKAPADAAAAVLLVDDDPGVRTVLAELLAQAGHGVTEASDAEEALTLLDGGTPVDVLVTDLSMPGAMNGLVLIDHARDRRPGLPAVLLTGYVDQHETGGMQPGGAFALLRKPATNQSLRGAIASVLDASPA